MNSGDTLVEVKTFMDLTHVEAPSNATMSRALIEYNTLKGSGHNKGQIANTWKSTGLLTPMQAAAFVNAMDQIEKGIPVQAPDETPSWSEVTSEVTSGLQSKFPWKTIILVGLAYAFVTQGLPNLLKK